MRWSARLVAFVAVVIATIALEPMHALAKPRLAVAPLDGDKDGAISDVVAESAAAHGKTTKPDKVAREIEKLEITSMSSKSVKKLRTKLEVDVVIHGKVERDGKKKHLELVVQGRGKAKGNLDVDFKNTKDLKKALDAKLGKEIDAASAGADDAEEGDDDSLRDREETKAAFKRDSDDKKHDDDKKRDDDDKRSSKRDDDDKRSSKRDDDDKHAKRDDDKRSKRDDDKRSSKRDDDDRRGKKRTSSRDDETSIDEGDDDEDRGSRRHKRKHRGDDGPRHPLTQASVWFDAGAGFARRTLTYTATGTTQPPRVGTAAAAGELEGEIYPASFSSLKGPAAGIGFAGAVDHSVGLGIAVPMTTVTTPIKAGAYWIGARYRFVFGSNSIAIGASYWKRYYIADRSKLMMPEQLDMPDVDYSAIAPDVTGRFAATPKIGVFGSLQVPLMLDAGPIQKGTSYGAANILAFDVRAGLQIALGEHYGLQFAAGFDQIKLTFNGKQGTQAALRGVSDATDRSVGLSATLGIDY